MAANERRNAMPAPPATGYFERALASRATTARDAPPLGGVEGDRATGRRFGHEPGPGLDRGDDGDDVAPFGHAPLGLGHQAGHFDRLVGNPRRAAVGLELEGALAVAEELEADVVEPLEEIATHTGRRRTGLAAGLTGADPPVGEPQHALAGLGPDVEGSGL